MIARISCVALYEEDHDNWMTEDRQPFPITTTSVFSNTTSSFQSAVWRTTPLKAFRPGTVSILGSDRFPTAHNISLHSWLYLFPTLISLRWTSHISVTYCHDALSTLMPWRLYRKITYVNRRSIVSGCRQIEVLRYGPSRSRWPNRLLLHGVIASGKGQVNTTT